MINMIQSPYFSFASEPFSRQLPGKDIFASQGQRELQARLKHAVQGDNLVVITGQVGSGKSTAIRAIMEELDLSCHRFIYLAHSNLTPGEFYRALLYQLNLQPKRAITENKRILVQGLLEWHHKGIKPIVVIDEAHELSVPMLGELRFALNFQADSFSPLMIVLAGQDILVETLRLQVLECIRQRISVYYHLPGLEPDEIGTYMLHHLKLAGCEKQIFTDSAIGMVAQFSKGIPRRINNICRNSIIAAMALDTPAIDDKAVQMALNDTLL